MHLPPKLHEASIPSFVREKLTQNNLAQIELQIKESLKKEGLTNQTIEVQLKNPNSFINKIFNTIVIVKLLNQYSEQIKLLTASLVEKLKLIAEKLALLEEKSKHAEKEKSQHFKNEIDDIQQTRERIQAELDVTNNQQKILEEQIKKLTKQREELLENYAAAYKSITDEYQNHKQNLQEKHQQEQSEFQQHKINAHNEIDKQREEIEVKYQSQLDTLKQQHAIKLEEVTNQLVKNLYDKFSSILTSKNEVFQKNELKQLVSDLLKLNNREEQMQYVKNNLMNKDIDLSDKQIRDIVDTVRIEQAKLNKSLSAKQEAILGKDAEKLNELDTDEGLTNARFLFDEAEQQAKQTNELEMHDKTYSSNINKLNANFGSDLENLNKQSLLISLALQELSQAQTHLTNSENQLGQRIDTAKNSLEPEKSYLNPFKTKPTTF